MESNKDQKQRLKIVFFSVLPPFRGGISSFSSLLLEKLQALTLVRSFTFKALYPKLLFPGKSQIDPSLKPEADRIVSTMNPFSYFYARSIMKKQNPDVFIVNYWMTLFGPMYAIFSKGFKSNVLKIALIHNINPHEKRFFDNFFNRLFLNRYDAFIVLSECVKGELLIKKPGASCLLLNHPSYSHFGAAVDKHNARERLNIPLNSKVLLFFGLIRDYKGLDVLLEAMNTLDEKYYLIVAGEVYGDDQSYLQQIENIPKAQVLIHNGYIPDDEVKYYFSASDLCVLPYKKGTQSGVQAISDSFCTPVLVSENGGLHEKIEEGRSGFIIDKLDSQHLANKIQNIFSGGKLDIVREKLQATLSNRGDEWKDFADQFLDFIESEKVKKNI